MIAWPASSGAAGCTGIAPAYLLDVEDANGNVYYWGSRKITAPSVIGAGSNPYLPWILSVGSFTFNRSMTSDTGSLQLQNLSGDSLQSDFQKIVRRSTLEGAIGVYREWNAGAQFAELEFHCKLSVDDSNPTKVDVTLTDINENSQEVSPPYRFSEICQWRWSSKQCGSTQPTPCMQTFPTCQVVERIEVIANSYEQNFGETWANVGTNVANRLRRF
jgi:phage-related protein